MSTKKKDKHKDQKESLKLHIQLGNKYLLQKSVSLQKNLTDGDENTDVVKQLIWLKFKIKKNEKMFFQFDMLWMNMLFH